MSVWLNHPVQDGSALPFQDVRENPRSFTSWALGVPLGVQVTLPGVLRLGDIVYTNGSLGILQYGRGV
jgi:hypothetical protein